MKIVFERDFILSEQPGKDSKNPVSGLDALQWLVTTSSLPFLRYFCPDNIHVFLLGDCNLII